MLSRYTLFNPLMLTVAKTSMTILMKFLRLKHSKVSSRDVDQNIANNSPSNIL